jgi:hypothetical protein
MVQRVKLTVRVDRESLESAKQYAAANNTSLSGLISEFLRALRSEPDQTAKPPILRKLTGILPPDTTPKEYHDHLDRKYG